LIVQTTQEDTVPRRRVRLEQHLDGSAVEDGIRAIQRELDVTPGFPPEVIAAAERAAEAPRLPDDDRTDIPFVTIDPPDAQDLDQALHIERTSRGYRVHYAIADMAAFVRPGDPVDVEAHRRGETLYGAGSKVPLHPPVLSEGAASLLPAEVRPALVWVIDLNESGEGVAVSVRRARVRSRAKLSYAQVQGDIDVGRASPMFDLLREVGELRQKREQVRGGVSLPLPEQEVAGKDGRWSLGFRAPLPVEGWNEQISLLTGMAAGGLMLYGEVGLLRTMPPPESRALRRLRRTATALDIDWSDELEYPDFVRTLDPDRPEHAAMLVACTTLLRGAGYVSFDGAVPDRPEHSALASEYAHATAPLRRLGDRYVGEICVALCANEPVPEWVRTELPGLPKTLQESGRRANAYESAVLDLVEAGVLADRVGEVFTGAVVEVEHDDPRRGVIVVRDPAVEARVDSPGGVLPLGEWIRARLVEADLTARRTRFEAQ
jgi:exoribonuclease R